MLVDWNCASLGDPGLDLAAWLPSLAVEWTEAVGAAPNAATPAWISGVWAATVGLPPPETPRPCVPSSAVSSRSRSPGSSASSTSDAGAILRP